MGLSLVRCPVCDRRYNVSGIPAGTRVLCVSCRSILTVPLAKTAAEPLWRRMVPQSASSQFVLALVGGLLLASGSYVLYRSGRDGAAGPLAQQRGSAAPAAPGRKVRDTSRDEVVASVRRNLYSEFDAGRFVFQDLAPFLLAIERSDRVLPWSLQQKCEPALDVIYATFMKEFREPLGLGDIQNEVLPCIVFTSRESFDAYCVRSQGRMLAREIPGIYEYARRRFVMIYDRAQAPLEVMMHEVVHQLVHHYALERCDGASKPTYWWFQEGLGTYFESVRRNQKTGQYEPGPVGHTHRLRMVQDALAGDRTRFIPLSNLMGMTVDDFWKDWYSEAKDEREQELRTRTAELAYGEACALVIFLRHGNEAKYRAVFDEYFSRELKGEGSRPRFEEILRKHHPGSDLSVLEEEFIEYVQQLTP